MFKKSLLFFSILFGITSLSGCSNNNEKISLTYGTYLKNAIKLNYDQLAPKMLDGENMIVIVYPGDNSTCGCWTVFEDILDDVVNNQHYQIYKISYAQFLSFGNQWQFPIYNDRPSLCFIENGKIKKTYEYDTRNVNPLFKSYDDFLDVINQNCYKPNYYYIDEQYLENIISTKQQFLIGYTWSSCPDCSYAFPNVLYPYSVNKQFKNKFYIIDLEVEGILLNDGIKDTTNENYVNFLSKYSLSNKIDTTFGYDRGFVPTFQYYENGILKDMCVYFNDAISLIDDQYVITRSYYSKQRVSNLPFFKNITNYENYILLDKTLSIDEVNVSENNISFKQESAAKYHDVILKTFLDTYTN